MPLSAPVSYDLKVFGATGVGGVFFKPEEAERRALEIVRDTAAEVVEVWRVVHKHYCGVTEIACTCKGVEKELTATLTQKDRARAPRRGDEPLFAAGAPARGRLSELARAADNAEL